MLLLPLHISNVELLTQQLESRICIVYLILLKKINPFFNSSTFHCRKKKESPNTPHTTYQLHVTSKPVSYTHLTKQEKKNNKNNINLIGHPNIPAPPIFSFHSERRMKCGRSMM